MSPLARTAKKLAAISLAFAFLLGSSQALQATTLANLLAGGSITVGPVTFQNFGGYLSNANGTASPVDPNDIFVTPITTIVNGHKEYGLEFNGATMSAPLSGTQDTLFSYDVVQASSTGPKINDASISMTGSADGNGRTQIIETLRDGNNNGIGNMIVAAGKGINSFDNHTDFEPTAIVHVKKNLGVNGGTKTGGGIFGAGISDFTQTFSVTPEPATVVMLGIGGLGLIGFGYMRRRSMIA